MKMYDRHTGKYMRCEREKSLVRKPPTVMSAVLVMPFCAAVFASVATVQRQIFSSGQEAL